MSRGHIIGLVTLVAGFTVVAAPEPVGAGGPSCATTTYTIVSVTVSESVGTASLTVTQTRTGPAESICSVTYTASNGTATAPGDYTATTATLNFPPTGAEAGTQTLQATVPIVNDAINEPTETFTVTLSAPTGGGALGVPSAGTVTITDDDPAPTTSTAAPTTTTTTTVAPTTTTTTTPAPSVTVSPNPVIQGGNVTVNGAGFQPGTTTNIFLLSTPVHLATAVADAAGAIRTTVTIPRGTIAGLHSIEVRGTDRAGVARVASTPLTVTAAAVLAVTGGADTASGMMLAGVIGGAGLALLAQARRRLRAVAPSLR